MKKRRLVVIAAGVLVTGTLVGLIPTGRYIALGLWRGEHFYRWRPTCYWSYYLRDTRRKENQPRLLASVAAGNRPSVSWWPRVTHGISTWWHGVTAGASEEEETDFSGRFYTKPPQYIEVFGRSGAVVPVLLELLRDNRPSVRSDAVWALAEVDPPPEEAVSALLEALGDSNCCVRSHAILALGRMGPAARQAVPALARLWEQADYLAGDALQKIDPETAKHTHPVLWTKD
jgi:hypothetical protein